MHHNLYSHLMYVSISVVLFLMPLTASAFNTRRLDEGLYFLGLVFIFVISLIVIGIALGVLTSLKKKGRMVKGHARIVRGLKIAPFLVALIGYMIYLAEMKF